MNTQLCSRCKGHGWLGNSIFDEDIGEELCPACDGEGVIRLGHRGDDDED